MAPTYTWQGRSVAGGKIIDAQSMAADIASEIIQMDNSDLCTIQLESASGTRVGTIAIQVSNDKTTWYTPTITQVSTGSEVSSISVVTSTSVADCIEIANFGWRFLRIYYTYTSGTGTLNAWAMIKRRN